MLLRTVQVRTSSAKNLYNLQVAVPRCYKKRGLSTLLGCISICSSLGEEPHHFNVTRIRCGIQRCDQVRICLVLRGPSSAQQPHSLHVPRICGQQEWSDPFVVHCVRIARRTQSALQRYRVGSGQSIKESRVGCLIDVQQHHQQLPASVQDTPSKVQMVFCVV